MNTRPLSSERPELSRRGVEQTLEYHVMFAVFCLNRVGPAAGHGISPINGSMEGIKAISISYKV